MPLPFLGARRESFVFETVFSEAVGDKLDFMLQSLIAGYTVVLCFIGIDSPEQSEMRVAMRISQGGHDVPPEKLLTRFARTITNLHAAIDQLPHVLVFDNSDLSHPFRLVAVYDHGQRQFHDEPIPGWLARSV